MTLPPPVKPAHVSVFDVLYEAFSVWFKTGKCGAKKIVSVTEIQSVIQLPEVGKLWHDSRPRWKAKNSLKKGHIIFSSIDFVHLDGQN